MSFIKKTNENQIRKIPTGADQRRSSPHPRDEIHKVTSSEETSGVVNVGFFFTPGSHELEVTRNSDEIYRAVDYIDGTACGQFVETSNYEIQFESGTIAEDDILRFRVTSNSYDTSESNASNINQIAKDLYGRENLNLVTNDSVSQGYYPIVASTYGASLDDTTIQAALNDIGSSRRTLHITRGLWDIDSNITVPTNVTLLVDAGARLTVDAAATLTINGVVFAPATQIFFGTLGNSIVNSYPYDDAWWGRSQKLYVNDINFDSTTVVYIIDEDRDTYVTTEYDTDEDKIRFVTNNNLAMVIENNQRVAINNTIIPRERLDLKDGSDNGAVIVGSHENGSPISGTIEFDSSNFRGYDGTNWILLDVEGGEWFKTIRLENSVGGLIGTAIADQIDDILTLKEGSNISLSYTGADEITISASGGAGGEWFKTIRLENSVGGLIGTAVADSADDTLTLKEGSNISLSYTGADEISIAATGGGLSSHDIDYHTDTDINSTNPLLNGDILVWVSGTSKWTNQASGGVTPHGLSAHTDVDPALGAVPGHALVYTASGGGMWTNQAISGTIGGGGSADYIPRFTPDGQTLANSLIQDDGSNIIVGGSSDAVFNVGIDAGDGINVSGGDLQLASGGGTVDTIIDSGDAWVDSDDALATCAAIEDFIDANPPSGMMTKTLVLSGTATVGASSTSNVNIPGGSPGSHRLLVFSIFAYGAVTHVFEGIETLSSTYGGTGTIGRYPAGSGFAVGEYLKIVNPTLGSVIYSYRVYEIS